MCGNYSASFRAGAAGVQPERLGHIQGKETSPVLASVILSKAKNPFLCQRSFFLFVQKVSKDTTGEGEDSESLPLPGTPLLIQTAKRECPFGFPLRTGGPAGRTITTVRVGKISVYPGGPWPSRVLYLLENGRILLEIIGEAACGEHHREMFPMFSACKTGFSILVTVAFPTTRFPS